MDNMEFRDQPYLGAVFVFSKDLSQVPARLASY